MNTAQIGQVSVREPQEGEKTDDQFEYIDVIVSSGRRDGHGTYVNERTLEKWSYTLRDKAIQLKDSHEQTQGFGVSTNGEYRDGKLFGTFKVLKGLKLSNASYPDSDSFLKAVRAGIITKTSVAWTGGKYLCNICGEDAMRSPKCNHYPDYEYDVTVNDNAEKQLCTWEHDDGRIIETSLVPAGSNQDAVILEKAQRAFDEGVLPVEVKNKYEQVHGYRFDDGKPVKSKEKNNGGSKVDTKQLEEQLKTVTEERDEAKAKVEELTPLAEEAQEARKYMSSQALEAFKVSRGEKIQESEIKTFETRNETLNFTALVSELEYLRTLAPEKPQVEPGSKTSQPDNSGDDKREQTQSGPVNPAHWGVNFG